MSSTELKDVIQIIAKDQITNHIIILTWDFENKMEMAMHQINPKLDQFPENYVVRGLNQKMNYLINDHSIYDLESNIPIQ